MYLYFLNNKSEALDTFKTYKVEVEKQKEKQIKIIRSTRGGSTTVGTQNKDKWRVHL